MREIASARRSARISHQTMTLTCGIPSLRMSIRHVVGVRAEEEMSRVAARRVVAAM